MRFSALLLLSLFAVPTFAQDFDQNDAAPPLLIDAAHCMTSKMDLLGLSNRKLTQLELGYRVNRKAYPGREVVDVVQYDNTMHTSGTVFTFLNEGREKHRVLRYQYKVQFKQPEDGSRRIELLELPFGGIGTRNRIVNAIYDIGFSTYRIPMAEIGNNGSTVCESDARADNQ
jgi:hypothetical protein